jgi:hypothetical protein
VAAKLCSHVTPEAETSRLHEDRCGSLQILPMCLEDLALLSALYRNPDGLPVGILLDLSSKNTSRSQPRPWISRIIHKFDTGNEHIAAGLIWASLCAAVLKRFLAHAAQIVGGKPISTRRVAMCAGHIINELVSALLASVSIAAALRDGLAFLLANARRSNPKRDRKTGRLRSGLLVVGDRS